MPPPPTASIKLLPLGASLQEFLLPLSTSSTPANLVLSYPSPESYSNNPFYIGNSVGRYANRITNGRLQLSTQTFNLPANNGPHTLHGGPDPWSSREWDGPIYELTPDGVEAAVFTLISKDGDNGFPGTVEAKARYSARDVIGEKGRKKVRVEIEYEVTLVEGTETAVNVTNHSYFNLCPGKATIEGTVAKLATKQYIPIDGTGVPIEGKGPEVFPLFAEIEKKQKDSAGESEKAPVFELGAKEPVIDDYFLFPLPSTSSPASIPLDTRSSPLRECARFFHPESKIHLAVESTEPGFQLYTGEYVDVEPREDGTRRMGPRSGFCVEPGRYTDAVSREEWKGMVVLKKGERWGNRIVYTAWEGEEDDM